MISSYLIFMFCYVIFIYKVLKFMLRKILPLLKKNVQVPSLNHYAPASSSRSTKYDVFLSFRGEDTRKTFVDHLYSALVDRQIFTYKDDQTLPHGEFICPSLFKAIEESRIAVLIFSKNYVGSSWCLEELAYIMKCKNERGLIVMPIFYDVEPSEVRKQKGNFGKVFAQQEVKNFSKAKLWRKALVDVSNIVGWELKNIVNGHESKVIKEIVDTILDRLFPLNSDYDEDLVGMTSRLQDLKSRLKMESGGVRMVGIWGVGGGGKTTLVSSLYMEISCFFESHLIVENIHEESKKYGLKKLQEHVLSTFLKTKVEVHSIAEGKHKIKNMLCRRKVLIILDDVNDADQLEALAGSHKWFGSGSRIVITTRDEHLLRTHKVDEVCHVRLLSHDEAIQLFNRHAFNEREPAEDYETLTLRVVSYADGLPLALKVLGSFLYDKEKNEWISALDKLKDIPDLRIIDILKISYDGLETYQKELFLDIACFWRWSSPDRAMEILEACGYHPGIGIKVLRQKALITIVDGKFGVRFDMHDLVQEMGHYIVRGEHPKNPEKHSRVWKDEEIRNMFFGDATMENDKIEAIRYDGYSHDHDHSSRFCKIVSNMKKLRYLRVVIRDGKYDGGPNFLSNELQYIHWEGYPTSPLPYSFQPMKLVVLKLENSLQKEVWKGCKHLPHLKVLQLRYMKKLLKTPDFGGLPSLQRLTLSYCHKLEEIHPSLGNHTSLEYLSVLCCHEIISFPAIVQMKNLKTLEIENCSLEDGKIPFGIGELSNLQELNLSSNVFSRLDLSLSQLNRLKILNLSNCEQLLELPELPSSLTILKADYCRSLTNFGDCHKNCKLLCQVSLTKGSIINDGDRLLQSMLEGKAIENGFMHLRLEGLAIPKGFTPPLFRGKRCRLKLPENWCNDFCGFLMCAVFFRDTYLDCRSYVHISVTARLMSGNDSDSQDDVVWEESDGVKRVWLWYVSFGSLKHNPWWDQTYKALSFSIEDRYWLFTKCSGFGVRLVDKKSRSGLTETTTNSSEYTPNFKIQHESPSALKISLHTTPYYHH